jgi:hypothetical protein
MAKEMLSLETSLKAVFDEKLGHLKFNAQLARKLYLYQVGFVSKNEEHMAFFGGKLLGVNRVRFGPKEYNEFYDEILKVDPEEIKVTFEHVEAIRVNRKVASDVFNQCCMYLIHRFLTSPDMSEGAREKAALDCGLIFNYRTIANKITDWFHYPADPKLAQATYANLSRRFLIKRLNNWQEVMVYRSQALIHPEGIHQKTLLSYTDDLGIVYLINDSQGRIKDMIKEIYDVMVKTQKAGEKIHSSSTIAVDADGSEIIRDKLHGLEVYTTYLFSVIGDRNSFIKQELVDIVAQVMQTMQVRGFVRTLDWISENSHQDKDIEELVRLVLIHSFNYLLDHGYVLHNNHDLAGLLTRLRGVYVSSRSGDDELLTLRDKGNALVTKAIGKTNEQAVAAIRTGLFLYICLRAYTKHYYTR